VSRAAIAVAFLSLAAMAGCAAAGQVTQSSTSSLTLPLRLASVSVSGLYIYDASARVKVVLTNADLVPASVHVGREAGGSLGLAGGFTSIGASKFCRLTRALAHRGQRLQHPQRFAFQVDGRVYARPLVDYRAFPDGLVSVQPP
jgi:hypothetical protein